MLYQAENHHFQGDGWDCDYLCFGTGVRPLLLLPGAGDGFQTAKGLALPFALLYRCFAKDWRVYVVSRRNRLPSDFTTRDMAEDLFELMNTLGLPPADVVGVSQGGMIAHHLALAHPAQVRRLVLAVTAPRPNPTMTEALGKWMRLAGERDFAAIMRDTALRSYTGSYLKRSLVQNALVGRLMQVEDFERFLTLCRACLTHDVYGELHRITCPTLVLGAGEDRVVGPIGSVELARGIPGAKLHLFPSLSHGAYEQAGDFNERVMVFLKMHNKKKEPQA